MDLHTARTMNMLGTALLGIIGLLVPAGYMFLFGVILLFDGADPLAAACFTIFICWIVFVIVLTYFMYKNSVKAIDQGDFETAKRWSLYGLVIGVVLGIGFAGFFIIVIFFLLSFITLNDHLKPRFYYPPYGYYPPPPPMYYQPPPQFSHHRPPPFSPYGYQYPPPYYNQYGSQYGAQAPTYEDAMSVRRTTPGSGITKERHRCPNCQNGFKVRSKKRPITVKCPFCSDKVVIDK